MFSDFYEDFDEIVMFKKSDSISRLDNVKRKVIIDKKLSDCYCYDLCLF